MFESATSIWNAWQQKFKSLKTEFDLQYCQSKDELISQIKNQTLPCTYLVDYEFSGAAYTGLELINFILAISKNRVFLVTSRSNDLDIQEFCRLRKVKIIPKFFAFNMGIKIIKTSHQKIVLTKNITDTATFPKDDDAIYYHYLNEFISDLPIFSKSSQLFIHKTHEESLANELKKYPFHSIFYDDLDSINF